MTTAEKAEQAKKAAMKLGNLDADARNTILAAIARELSAAASAVFAANGEDLERSRKEGLSAPLLKRLNFDAKKLAEVVAGIESLVALPDPLGKVQGATELDAGLELYRVTVPLGVIAMIFESRPDALVQIASLALKSGNGLLLKGGREAASTNRALWKLIHDASVAAGAPEGWISLLESREEVGELLSLDGLVDLVIPRGSNEFVRYIMDNTRIPVMGHADGICHLYVDEAADTVMAVRLAMDSKTQYVAVCNALETLLVHEAVAGTFLPALKKAADEFARKGTKLRLRGCERTRAFIDVEAAEDADWATEYLDYVLSIRVVSSLEDAVAHIARWGSGHTDSIVTADRSRAELFMNCVDSANVFWNCSTRFSDGFRYGLGAEVGVSTGKLHARGPVGLDGLTTYKWKLYGTGQEVAPYASGERKFTHKAIR